MMRCIRQFVQSKCVNSCLKWIFIALIYVYICSYFHNRWKENEDKIFQENLSTYDLVREKARYIIQTYFLSRAHTLILLGMLCILFPLPALFIRFVSLYFERSVDTYKETS